MSPERWELISRIFNEAVALEVDDRERYVATACADDPQLANEVASLLSAHEKAGDFIENPIVENMVGDISEMPTLTGTFLAHYRIEKSIGRGGMGDVYLATDTRLDRLVALKKLPDRCASDPLLLKRLRTEARAAASLNHPNVATIYSVEEADSRTFITMEYVEGRTLDSVAPSEGMGIKRFLDIFLLVASALAHAHEKGIVHRDLKPGNIMITTGGEPKLLDFGLAQFAEQSPLLDKHDPSITKPGQIIGTPSYMSPEQAKGIGVDHRTDIFSLGVVMYEALSGVKPFVGQNGAEVISNILKTDPASVSSVRSGIPTGLSRLVARCLEKRRSDRPQTMDEVRTALADAQKLLVAGTSTGSFARRLYRESGSIGLWLRLAPVLLVIGAATLAWLYISKDRSRPRVNFEKMAMRRLSDTNNVGFAQISPDGRSVAFATFEADGKSALWIRRIDDPNPHELVAPQPVQFWGGIGISPDGGQVFYITADRLGNHGTLFKVSSLGGPSRKLVDFANDVGGLSPDGERILFVRYGDPSAIISAKSSDGTDEQTVLTGPPGEPRTTGFRDPQYSVDGRSVYFIRHRQENGIESWSVEVIGLVDRSVRTIFTQPERISEMAVLPDSDSLLVTAVDPVSNLQQIFDVSIADGKRTRLTNDVLFYFGVSADRTGRNIVASQRSEEQRIWVGDTSNLTDLRPVSQVPNARQNVDWTADGRLVFDGFENNVSHIWVADIDGRNLQRLTPQDSDDSQPLVSHDGRYIVFVSDRSGRSQVFRMNADGTDQKALADVNGITQSPELSADGRNVIFEWLLDQNRSLVSVPIEGGALSEVHSLSDYPMYNLFYRAESPNGAFVAESFWENTSGLVKIAVRRVNSPAPPIVLDIWPSLIFKWSPDSSALYYRSRQVGYQPESELLRIDPQTGKSSTVLSTVPEYIVDISFSRDGKRAAVVRGKNISNAVMLSSSE